MNENDRIPVEELSEHPFIAEALENSLLNELDIDNFSLAMSQSERR